MRFLIDLQCAQSGSRSRGIGRYTLSLLDAMLPQATAAGHDVHLLLNAAFPATIPDIQRRYPALHRSGHIHVFQGLDRSGLQDPNGPWRKAASGLLRDFAIAGLAPDAVFCPSVFEGDSEAFALTPLVLSDTPSLATQHDLIPAQMPAIYFDNNPGFAAFYRARMAEMQHFTALIAVSEATRQEARTLLDYPAAHLHLVPEDAGPQFTPPGAMSLSDMTDLRSRHGLMRPYILYVGGGEPRKNLMGLIRAYGGLPQGLRDAHDLVIAGTLTIEEHRNIHQLAQDLSLDLGRIRILGHTPEEDLPGLYGLAALFVMPSLREGFGLPALEAIRCGTLTLGTDATSLPEVIGTPETLFDPADIPAQTALIIRGLTDSDFAKRMRAAQQKHAAQFSWDKAACDTLALLERYAQTRTPVSDWPAVQSRLDALEPAAITALQNLPPDGLTEGDRDDLARALAITRLAIEDAWRPRTLPDGTLRWQIEGPFDSDYSLASVNRETALALEACGIDTALVSAEGDGAFDPDPAFLADHPDVATLHTKAPTPPDILSRNMFPPRVSDMGAPLNLLHGYAWEETGLPLSFTRDMTAHLQGLLVTAPHVKKLMQDAGIGLPVHVVGNGVDHLDVPPAPLPAPLPKAAFTLLHVSSCFPRKGVDVLLAGFAEAFAGQHDVQLVIKTFANPHNDIADQITALQAAHPDLPSITVIDDPLTPGQMRSLYAAADLLVAPSRAEGYCLPVAEAVLAGTPVLTTGWGGQRIFAGNPLVHFTGYSFAPTTSHLGAWDSVWAEPDLADLVAQMQQLRAAPAPDARTRSTAKKMLLQDHTWAKVAERSEQAARRIAAHTPAPPPKIGWISSYNTRCGIATYSEHLIRAFPDAVTVFASHTEDRPAPDGPEVRRCWHQNGRDPLADLRSEIDRADPQVLVIQFNYGFYSFPDLAALILAAQADGRRVVMMMHATDDRAVPPQRKLASILPALRACDLLLVHAHHDLNHLKALGLEDNVALFPHGVPHVGTPAPLAMTRDRPVTLGTYGFFLPPKGLDKLIEALALIRAAGENVALNMVNAEYPVASSTEGIAAARARIAELGLTDHVILETAFLEDDDSFARLSRSDALVFPYQHTAESASGAIRQALALDRPVIATSLRIFDDVDPLITRLPGTSAQDIADGLIPLVRALRDPAAHPEVAQRLATTRDNVTRWRQSHAYQTLAPRLWRQICALCDPDTGGNWP
ncbi:Glycosyl transferase group 1 [Sulfitobacter noctilucae]|uniref:glycosyltransferase n=1 Tax=Sulfitobacter noctilucae TaxID=1342302 RepID=UPI000469D07B|nr:glycosyltransferase [Sulfitobacter noctilucae]KIN70144.1 Glycosyl transferase group 1 [Sulfitobacter noctilucae]